LNDNRCNFGIYDTNHDRLKTITVSATFVNGKTVYYFIGFDNLDIPSNASTAYCIDCVNVFATNLNMSNNLYGVFLYNCSNVTVFNVTTDEVNSSVYIYMTITTFRF